jgi:hypothetical protein
MLVPPPVQQEIATQVPPLVAYVPAQVGTGWKYLAWVSPHGEVQIVFAKGGQQVIFIASRYRGDCSIGMRKSFAIAGVTVYYTRTAAERRAWRCVNGVRLMAATSVPSDRFADVSLARTAASAYRVQRIP